MTFHYPECAVESTFKRLDLPVLCYKLADECMAVMTNSSVLATSAT